MMSAPSLPATPAAMPPGFASFLATIGQVTDGGSESAGFDQLLAAAPMAPAASIKTDPLLPVEGSAPQAGIAPAEAAVVGEVSVVKAEPGEAGAAAALAANLLMALNGSLPVGAPATGKPVPAETGAETETDAAPSAANTGEAAAPAPVASALVASWIPVAAPVTTPPAAGKPDKPAETAAAPAGDAAPTAPIATRPRNAAPSLPALAVTSAETPAAKPAEAAPSMTILFAQPTAQGAATLAGAAAPVQIAERILDMDSDGVWIDQLARDIAATKSDSGDISFRLMPRHLGRLDVAMQMGDEGMSLKMDTQHEATATIVTAAQARLVDDLRQQGVRVAGAEVTCTPGETGRQSQGQGRAAAPDPSHLIETATEGAEPRPKTDSEDRAADRRGRFA